MYDTFLRRTLIWLSIQTLTFIPIDFSFIDNRAVDNADPIDVLRNTQSTSEPGSKIIVIIDSISSFMMMYPEKCYKTIHNLVNQPLKGNIVLKYFFYILYLFSIIF